MARKSDAEKKKTYKKNTAWLDEHGIRHPGMRAFLVMYVKVGTISGACGELGFGVSKIEGWRKGHSMSHGKPSTPTDEGDRFEAAFLEAKQRHVEALEAELDRRAMRGSDNLLMFRLKGLKPEIYRESWRTAGGPNNLTNPPAVHTQVNQLIQIGLQDPEKLKAVMDLAEKHGLMGRLMGPGAVPVEVRDELIKGEEDRELTERPDKES